MPATSTRINEHFSIFLVAEALPFSELIFKTSTTIVSIKSEKFFPKFRRFSFKTSAAEPVQQFQAKTRWTNFATEKIKAVASARTGWTAKREFAKTIENSVIANVKKFKSLERCLTRQGRTLFFGNQYKNYYLLISLL